MCSAPEILRLLFRMPRFRDWADIFRDTSFSIDHSIPLYLSKTFYEVIITKTSVFHASVLLLTMNFVIPLSKWSAERHDWILSTGLIM